MNVSEQANLRVLITETRAAREALEAKGAFKPENAAAHLVMALEALIRSCDFETVLRLQESFETGNTFTG